MDDGFPPSWYFPHFQSCREGILPDIKLPHNYRELVPKFYSQGRKEDVERFREDLTEFMKQTSLSGEALEIRLLWNERLGLTNIGIGIHGGLDILDEDDGRYIPHNLGGKNGLYAGMIAIDYVRELMQAGE